MIKMFFSLCGIFSSILFLKESSCQTKSSLHNGMLPLAIGNEWIYIDSVTEEGKLISVSNDTLRIEKISSFENATTYLFNDGREMMVRGDTLFQLVLQRGGSKFPTVVFYPSETESSFNYAFGGDVVVQRTVNRMSDCPKSAWSNSKCYKVTDSCHG
ncbi:MAG: hypothetical protein ACHQD9_08220, partial [Chitinophagales bacterium]